MYGSGFMGGKRHYLNKMTVRDLIGAYFQYYAIQGYLIIGAVSTYFALANMADPVRTLASAVAAVLMYPLAWFLIHRYLLHGRIFYKSALTAKVWKRIHYDHHQDPHDLSILFGALYTTLPTISLATLPVGWLIAGAPGAAAALAAGMFMTCFYEFCHCIEHLTIKPKSKWLSNMKRRHMAHHFHDEDGNFGITNFLWDRVFGTYYAREDRPEKSLYVNNLGYTEEEAAKYPWVALHSGGVNEHTKPRDRRQAS